ncbi:PAS domain S-box-containing protein [Fodinibius salinus]|uniref:histidine kinase n=1 Tax=Fodinibius salinus TaxID=860790 RepID=A0A5D3YGL8_9BACT|nr:PAS domain S-box protein [Fodinibius salinus]TYP92702.1 PAS domain S-box-containing protein [Fodinibius salinus]
MDRFLFDLNPNPVLIYQADSYQILTANDAFSQKYGYTKDEVAELTIFDIHPQDEYQKIEEVLQILDNKESSKTKSIRHISKEGEIFYVDITSDAYTFEDKKARLVVVHDITDRIRAEEKAEQAFQELNHLVEESPLALVKWDVNFKIQEWSKRAEEITGFPKDFVEDNNPEGFLFSGRDQLLVEQSMRYLISGRGDRTNFECKMYHRDGTLVDLRIHASALRDENDDIVSILTLMEDITNRKKTEERYHRLFKNANDGIFLIKDKEFVECNQQVLEIYGCNTKKEIIGHTPLDFSPEHQPDGQKSSQKADRKIQNALDGTPQVFEWKHHQKDGTPINVEVSLNRLELAEGVYIQAIIRDLTEQKKAQRELKKSEQLFKNLFFNTPAAIAKVDRHNKVTMVNDSFERLFGFTEEELVGKDLNEAIVPQQDEISADLSERNLAEDKLYKEVTRFTKDDEERDLLFGTVPVYVDGEAIGGFGIYVDITEQKQNQRKLQKSLDEKQVLLSEVHHRVKNNLAVISGFLQLQALQVDNEQTQAELENSYLRIQSMALVHEMLYESKNFGEILFGKIIDNLVNKIKKSRSEESKNIDIETTKENVTLDINQAVPLTIIINEVVANCYAHAFNEESGVIEIELQKTGKLISVEIQDNGVGLPDNFSVEDQSTVGMNVISKLTNQLKGNLRYEDNNKGAWFEISFTKAKRKGSNRHTDVIEN